MSITLNCVYNSDECLFDINTLLRAKMVGTHGEPGFQQTAGENSTHSTIFAWDRRQRPGARHDVNMKSF